MRGCVRCVGRWMESIYSDRQVAPNPQTSRLSLRLIASMVDDLINALNKRMKGTEKLMMITRAFRRTLFLVIGISFVNCGQEEVDGEIRGSSSSNTVIGAVLELDGNIKNDKNNDFIKRSSAVSSRSVLHELPEVLDSIPGYWEFCKAVFPDDPANQIMCIKGELERICDALNSCRGDITTGDSDSDGTCNDIDPDDDDDGWSDADEVDCGSDPLSANSVPDDSDGDNIPDCKDTSALIDDSFGIFGEFVFSSQFGLDGILDAVTAPDGSIFLTGWLANEADDDLVLMKLTQNGVLDVTLNGTGYITRHNIAGGADDDWGESINIAPDGDLIISGHSIGPGGYTNGFLWKVSPGGVDDPAFASSGMFLVDVGVSLNNFKAKYDDYTGNIVAVGVYDSHIHAFRIKADGSGYDASFHFNGKIRLFPFRSIHPSLLVFPDGSLLIAGACQIDGGYDACSWRLNTDGMRISSYHNYNDQTLAHAGLAGGSGYDGWYGIDSYQENRVIVAGLSESTSNSADEIIARINTADGTLDESFGLGDGLWTEDVVGIGKSGRVCDVHVKDDGSIIAAFEFVNAADNWNVGILKLNENGIRDTNFSPPSGFLSLGGDFRVRFPQMIVQSNGRVLVFTSRCSDTGCEAVVWALNPP